MLNKQKPLLKNNLLDESNIKQIVISFIHLASIFLDLYQLARIFKVFNTNDSRFSSEPKNIISYAGDNHSDFLRSALDTLGFELVTEEKSSLIRCLDVINFDPFFSKPIESIEKQIITKTTSISISNISIEPNPKGKGNFKVIITKETPPDLLSEFKGRGGVPRSKEIPGKHVWYFGKSKKDSIIEYLEQSIYSRLVTVEKFL